MFLQDGRPLAMVAHQVRWSQVGWHVRTPSYQRHDVVQGLVERMRVQQIGVDWLLTEIAPPAIAGVDRRGQYQLAWRHAPLPSLIKKAVCRSSIRVVLAPPPYAVAMSARGVASSVSFWTDKCAVPLVTSLVRFSIGLGVLRTTDLRSTVRVLFELGRAVVALHHDQIVPSQRGPDGKVWV